MAQVTLSVEQIDETASQANVRNHKLVMDRPEAKGGTNAGMMGGEALLSGLGGCFMSNLLAAAQARDIKLTNVKAEITGELSEEGPSRFVAVQMKVSDESSKPEDFAKLVTIAERGCISANTLRGSVKLTVEVV